MKFSIIVCAFNEEKVIERCLKSLVKINFSIDQFEVLIINDGSNDQTESITEDFIHKNKIKNFKHIKIKHAGLSVARNAGIDNSNFDIILFIDADAVVDKNILNAYLNTYKNNKVEFSGGKISLLNTESKVAHFFQKTRFRQNFNKYNYKEQLIGANMSFKKRLFYEDGGFPNIFVSRGDDTFIREKFLKKYNYEPSPDAIVLHERPSNFLDCLKIFYVESINGDILNNILGRQSQKKKIFKLFLYLSTLTFLFFWPYLIIIFSVMLLLKSFKNSLLNIKNSDRSFSIVTGYTLLKIIERMIKEFVFFRTFFSKKQSYNRSLKNYSTAN